MSSYPEHPFNEVVAKLRESPRPIARWAGTSIAEIYLQGDFSMGRVKGSRDMNLQYTPRVLRIVGWHEGDYIGVGLVLFNARRHELRSLGRELRNEQASLPNVGLVDNLTLDIVTTTLLRQGKQTIAALEIASAVTGGSKVVQVLYPKFLRSLTLNIYGSLGIRLDETTERDMALGIAIKFLKTVPFGSPEATILNPENLE